MRILKKLILITPPTSQQTPSGEIVTDPETGGVIEDPETGGFVTDPE